MARAKKATLATTSLKATTTDGMAKYKRMDYPSGARQFGGLESEAINEDGEIILPTDGCKNFDVYVCKDTMKVLWYYEKDGWTEMK